MELFVDYIQDALSGCEIDFPQDGAPLPRSISRIEAYTGQHVESGVLYVADNEPPAQRARGLFLVATDRPDAFPDCLRVSGVTAAEALNRVLQHLARVLARLEKLRACYYERHDLEEFCTVLAAFVGNPVIAYDDNVIPIAQTAFPPDFAHREFGADSMTTEYAFKSITEWAREDNPYPLPSEGFGEPGAFRTVSHDDERATIMSGIVIDGVTYGFLEIFEVNRPATAGEMRLLEEACRILAMPYPFEENRFFASRLEGRMTQQGLTNAWLAAMRWRRGDPFFVVVVNLPNAYSDSMHNMVRAMQVLRSLVPSSVCVQMGNVPVLVANDRISNRQRLVDTLARFFKDTGTAFQIGTSELLSNIGRLHQGYVHAHFAAQYAARPESTSPVLFFEDCQFAFMRSVCLLDENKDTLLDAAVAHMHADDLESGTDNVLTAKTYIETGFNLNATAQAISVHRNTVAYRLKQIHDRYGIDLSVPVADHDLVFRVLLSCKILLGDS